jgi:hypothetical protein
MSQFIKNQMFKTDQYKKYKTGKDVDKETERIELI